jgi:hypothetical protein
VENQFGGNPAGGAEAPKIPNNLVLAIVSTVCCGCLPFGIAAIVFAAQVDKHIAAGDYVAAENASKKARLFAILSWVFGIMAAICGGILGGSSAYMQNHQ